MAEQFCKINHHELIDFIYKIFILQSKQKEFTYQIENDCWANQNCSQANHHRIGSSLNEPFKDFGEITDFSLLPTLIKNLKENESYELGLYDETGYSHSILVYKYKNTYHLFDSNIGQKVTCNNEKALAEEIILASNRNYTEGTNKYTTFDKLWKKSNVFKILCFTLLLPAVFFWLIYDLLIEKPLSDEALKKGPLSSSLWLSWGKISAIEEVESVSKLPSQTLFPTNTNRTKIETPLKNNTPEYLGT